jgi:hypothetical protein
LCGKEDRMDDTERGGDPERKSRNFLNAIRFGVINYVKRKLEKRRARREKESASERAERRTANATWFIGLLTLVIAGVGAAQWRVLTDTVDEMRSEQRPWIKIDSIHVDSFTSNEGAPYFYLTYNISNVGHTPAVNVLVQSAIDRNTKFITIGGSTDILRRFCNEDSGDFSGDFFSDFTSLFVRETESGKDIIFPGTQDFVNSEATDRHAPSILKKGGLATSHDVPKEWFNLFEKAQKPNASTIVESGSILLFSCIVYQEASGGKVYHTGTTAELSQNSGAFEFIEGVRLPGTRVKIQRPSVGWENYAD